MLARNRAVRRKPPPVHGFYRFVWHGPNRARSPMAQSLNSSRVRATPEWPPIDPTSAHRPSLTPPFASQLPDGLSAEQLRRSLEGIPSTIQGALPSRAACGRPAPAARPILATLTATSAAAPRRAALRSSLLIRAARHLRILVNLCASWLCARFRRHALAVGRAGPLRVRRRHGHAQRHVPAPGACRPSDATSSAPSSARPSFSSISLSSSVSSF